MKGQRRKRIHDGLRNRMKSKQGIKEFMRNNFSNSDFDGLFSDDEMKRLNEVKRKRIA